MRFEQRGAPVGSEKVVDFTVVEGEYLRSRFLSDFEWTRFDSPTDPVPLLKPVSEARVALVTTSGAYLPESQQPFDVRNPLGDDSFRVVPGDVAPEDIRLAHPGYDTRRAAQDLDCVFPLGALRDLQSRGLLGRVAPRHLSFMGYIPRTDHLLAETAPEAARILAEDEVDLAILVPS